MNPNHITSLTHPSIHTIKSRQRKWNAEINNWMVNDGSKIIFMVLWMIIQLITFTIVYMDYLSNTNYPTVKSIVGQGLCVAKASAAVISLNSGAILLTMCRKILTFLRRNAWARHVIPFDAHIEFHIYIAGCILFFSLVHSAAHVYNYICMAPVMSSSFTHILLTSGPGYTGIILWVIFLFMGLTSLKIIKRFKYEIFWYSHHIFILYYVFLAVHGSYCFIKSDNVHDVCKGGPSSWKYWIGFLSAYVLERLIRECSKPVSLLKVIQHPSHVYQLFIKKSGFMDPKPGQYVYIQCPEISLFEWHPFTLTSCSNEEYLSVHIRAIGDWTSKFAEKCQCRFSPLHGVSHGVSKDASHKFAKKNGMIEMTEMGRTNTNPIESESLPKIRIHGSFGSASQEVFDFKVSILIGAGIGVTPFASILKELWFKFKNPDESFQLTKVYFIWIVREKHSFEWFQDLLHQIELDGMSHLIEIQIFLTQKLAIQEIKNIVIHDSSLKRDVITGLQAKTHYGRPNLDVLFPEFVKNHANTDIGVFYCGPVGLSRQIWNACNQWTSQSTRFYYGKENF